MTAGIRPGFAGLLKWLSRTGRWLFALPLIIFGWQHLEYARFIATLIPKWIPAHMFWVYFTAMAFIVAALAILAEKFGRLAATWLGIMFCSGPYSYTRRESLHYGAEMNGIAPLWLWPCVAHHSSSLAHCRGRN